MERTRGSQRCVWQLYEQLDQRPRNIPIWVEEVGKTDASSGKKDVYFLHATS